MISLLKPLHGWFAAGSSVLSRNGRLLSLVWLIPASGYLLLYSEALQSLIKRWNSDDYSHCYLVPILSAYLIYQRMDRLQGQNGGAAWPGYLGLGISSALFLAGMLGSLETLVYLSLWLSVISVLILMIGAERVRALSFPLAMLLFAVPAPPFITRTITLKLRLLSSAISVEMLQLLGISAFREGNIIDLGAIQLQVVEACSGLRYLFPTLIVAIVMGYLFNSKAWHRVLLAAFSVPVSILMNSLRIIVMALLAMNGFSEASEEGMLHDGLGLLVFVVSIASLFLLSWGLERLVSNKPRSDEAGSKIAGQSQPARKAHEASRAGRSPWLNGLVAGMVFLALYFTQGHLSAAQSSPVRKDFASFPTSIAGWEGKREYLDQKILSSLWADDYITGSFHNRKTGNGLQLLVSYYSHQTAEHTAHAPTSCLLGGGWILKSKHSLPPDPSSGRAFSVQQMLLTKDGHNILSNFWFQQRGRIITDEYLNKLYLFWDSITRSRTDGALVRVEMQLLPGQSIEEAQSLLDVYTTALQESLREYVPD